MKEIKFRGLDVNGNYHYGNLIYGKNGICYISVINKSPISKNGDYWYIDTPCYEVSLIEQFTGCYDRDGKEIWEGDQINEDTGAYTEVVFFERGCFGIKSIIDDFMPMTDVNLSMYALISKDKNL
jgi:hypothetical protein